MTLLASGATLLLVEDDVVLRNRLARAFETRGHPTTVAGSFDEAIAAFDAAPTELVVLDLRIPGGSGLALLAALRARVPAPRVVIVTGYGSIPLAVQAVHLGAVDFVTKPVDADALLTAFDPDSRRNAAGAAPPSLARTEWEHIQRILQECGGNITHAADRLRIDRRTLQRKLARRPPRG